MTANSRRYFSLERTKVFPTKFRKHTKYLFEIPFTSIDVTYFNRYSLRFYQLYIVCNHMERIQIVYFLLVVCNYLLEPFVKSLIHINSFGSVLGEQKTLSETSEY